MLGRVWLIASAWWLLALSPATGWCATDPNTEVTTISTAEGSLEPDGKEWREGTINLDDRWDILFPGHEGRASYRVALPPHAGKQPMGVFFSRVGNQVEVRINGSVVERWGTLGDPRYDAAKNGVMVVLPAVLLFADKPNELEVDVTIQAQRWGGLSVLRYGPEEAIQTMYDEQRLWRNSAMVVFAASLAGMGGLALMLWWRQRDPLYGWFALAAFLGVVRNVDRVWPDVPVSWPLWGGIVAVCYASHLALICRFTLMALGPVSREMNRGINVVLVLSSALAILSFALGRPLFWTLGLAALVPLGVVSLTFVVREALRTRSMTACVLAAAGTLAVGAGVYDLGLIRMTNSSGLRNAYTQHAMFVFVVIMAGLVAERYSRSVADYRALNTDLSQRVEDREQQLRGAFDSLRAQQHEQSVSTERQRIMREIHDGIGSHLVGLLNMVTRPNADMVAVQEQVQHALDEMRMAVDSLQPVHDDLITVLATLRYRLQPRLQAAGVDVVWDVAELPALRHLSPNAVLQVQRILLEAFTNVLKHACATQVAVRTRWYESDRLVSLQIADNGVGLRREAAANGAALAAGAPPRQGRGIGNMRARATSIGAELKVEPAKGGGTCLTLAWRVDGESVEGLTAG